MLCDGVFLPCAEGVIDALFCFLNHSLSATATCTLDLSFGDMRGGSDELSLTEGMPFFNQLRAAGHTNTAVIFIIHTCRLVFVIGNGKVRHSLVPVGALGNVRPVLCCTAENDRIQLRAVGKRLLAETADADRQVDFFHGGTAAEGFLPDGRNTVWDLHLGESCAESERFLPDGRYPFWYFNRGQGRA